MIGVGLLRLDPAPQPALWHANELKEFLCRSYPFVMRLGGWAALGLLVIFSLICNHTAKLMGVMMDVRSPIKLREGPNSHTIIGFQDLARVSLGRM